MKRSILLFGLFACLVGCGGPSAPVVEEDMDEEEAPATADKEPGRGKPVGYWIARLRGTDANANSEAAGILVRLGKAAVPALIEVLKDPDEQVRRRGRTTLGRIGASAAPDLIAVLPDAQVGPDAVGILIEMKDAALPALIEGLGHRESKVRAGSASVLEQLGIADEEAGAALCKALRDKDPAVRAAAAAALGSIGPDADSIAVLTAALRDQQAPVRAGAARALGKAGNAAELREALPALLALLKDADPVVRANAAGALGRLRPQGLAGIVTALRKCLTDPMAPVRVQAAYALGAIRSHPHLMIPDLAIALKQDPEAKVRASAAGALGVFVDQADDVVPPLTAALKDKVLLVRQATIGALQNMDEAGLKAIARSARSPFVDVRSAGIKAAIALGGAEAEAVVPILAEGLASKLAKEREEAAQKLSDLGPVAQTAVPALSKALQDTDASVGRKAAEALGKIGKPAIPALTKALQSNNDDIRGLAAEGLAAAGPAAKDAVPALADLLRDPKTSIETKKSVAAALEKVGPAARPAIPVLIEVIQEKKQDDAIRRNAAAALVHIGEPAVPALAIAFRNVSAPFYIRDALRKIGKPAVSAVAEALTDKNRSVRERAAVLLGDIGADAEEARPALTRAAKDPDPGVSKAAQAALKKIRLASVGKE